jgi:hypothetical protein
MCAVEGTSKKVTFIWELENCLSGLASDWVTKIRIQVEWVLQIAPELAREDPSFDLPYSHHSWQAICLNFLL